MTTGPPTSPGTSSSPMAWVTPSSDGATARRRAGPVEAEGVLGDEPPDSGDQAQPGARSRTAACRSARSTEQIAQRGDGVGGVVVARASEVGEPAGDGQSAGAVPGDAQRL